MFALSDNWRGVAGDAKSGDTRVWSQIELGTGENNNCCMFDSELIVTVVRQIFCIINSVNWNIWLDPFSQQRPLIKGVIPRKLHFEKISQKYR